MHRMITMHARPRQTDRQTDEHHGNNRVNCITTNTFKKYMLLD